MEFCEEMVKKQNKTKIPTTIPPLGPSSRNRKRRAISPDFTLQLIHSGTSKEEKTREPSRLFAIWNRLPLTLQLFSLKAFFFLSLKALHCEQSEVNKAPSTGASWKYNTTGSELSIHPLEK